MKQLVIALLAVSSSAFASSNTYDLKMDLSLDGKHVASPRMIVKEGASAEITQENLFIEVVATESSAQNHKGIVLMKFTVGTIGKNGERTVASKSQILTREGEPAQITQSDAKSGVGQFSLSVVAKKTAL